MQILFVFGISSHEVANNSGTAQDFLGGLGSKSEWIFDLMNMQAHLDYSQTCVDNFFYLEKVVDIMMGFNHW